MRWGHVPSQPIPTVSHITGMRPAPLLSRTGSAGAIETSPTAFWWLRTRFDGLKHTLDTARVPEHYQRQDGNVEDFLRVSSRMFGSVARRLRSALVAVDR